METTALGSRAGPLACQARSQPPAAAAAGGPRLAQQQHRQQRPCLLQVQRPLHTTSSSGSGSFRRSGSSSSVRLGRRRLAPRAALPEALAALEAAPARDVAAGLFAVCGSVALIKFFDTLEGAGVIDQHLSRKLVHMLAGPGFMLCWPLFSAEPSARLVAAAVPALNGLRLLLIGSGLVKDERAVMAVSRTGDPAELLRGPLYYVIVLMAITTLFWRCSPTGLVVAAVMCGGDGLADIVGRRLGRGNPLPWNRQKSWAGSTAMLAGGVAMALGLVAAFSSLGYFEVDWPSMAATVAGISLAATIIESLPINQTVDDNLAVPGVAALLGSLAFRTSSLAAVAALF